MADLRDLQQFAHDIVPVFRDLFRLVEGAPPAAVGQPALAAIAKLQKLAAEASVATVATNIEAAAAVTAVRGTVLALLTEAAGSPVALAQTDLNTMQVLFNSLEARAGRLLAQAAFASIPTLISAEDLRRITADLQQAEVDIRTRQQAKEVLNAVVNTVIVAARIAAKVAV